MATNGRTNGFILDTCTQIGEVLRVAGNWKTLQEEYGAMGTNTALPTQTDVDAVFGFKADGTTSLVTLTQYNNALLAQQAIVDAIFAEPTRGKLYRVRR